EQAHFAEAARGRAAEQHVDRLLLRFAGGGPAGARDRWREAEVGRDDQRRVARHRELVGRTDARPAVAEPAAASSERRTQQQHGEGLTHSQQSPWDRSLLPDPYGPRTLA